MKRLLTFALLFFTLPAWAAVAALGTASSDQGASVTASVSNTVASGSNVVCYIGVFANGDTAISSMANFGGVAPQLVGSFVDAIHLYRVVSPATGSTTAQANLAADVFWSIHVQCFSGVDTTDPDDTPETNTEIETTSVSSPAMTSAVGDMVVAIALMVYPDIDAFAGATLSTEEESITGSVVSTAMVYEIGAASVTVGAQSSTASFGDNRILAANINASSGGGASGLLLRRRRS